MTCDPWRERIEADRLGALDAVGSRALAGHLAGCAGCRRYRDEAEAMERAIATRTDGARAGLDWPRLARGIVRTSRFELRGLIWNSTLLVTTVAAAIALDPGRWWTVGLLLFALPSRIESYRADRRERARLADATGEWIEYCRRRLDREWGRSFLSGLFDFALAALFALLALVGKHPLAAAVVAAVMVALGYHSACIRAPRLRRERDAFARAAP